MTDAILISQSILGQDLTAQDCELLSLAVTHRSLEKGEILFDEGSTDETLYILISGKLEVLKMVGSDHSISIDILKEGSMTGELSFIDGHPHTMRLIAKKDSNVLMLHKTAFENLVEKHPLVTYHVMRSILRYSHMLQRKMNVKYLEMHRMVQNQYTAQY
ncbi:Crp/Fnr family transcriptional regulator [Thiomicrorhabdus aquaedulcis]|uniref:Crp/Fnr family transcriptional regulator n=1 Tax=Thiomicrorhabdus aquaedulcis TaxID=2211106 RepID=UPI000FDCD761|nr:cyclic nucleotide-binding domain-containing protein [Thiomicrorhabdus aquaedulcis]